MGAPGLEPGTSALSGPRSHQAELRARRRCAEDEAELTRTRTPVGATSATRQSGGDPPHSRDSTSRPARLPGRAVAAHPRRWGPADPHQHPNLDHRSAHNRQRHRHPSVPLARPRQTRRRPVWALPRKEVIQPQLPLRLPCYDFVPITSPTLDGCRPEANLQVSPPASGVAGFRDVTGGVYKAREHIHRSSADPRLLATPASRGRVAAPDPN